ncbi:cytochrome c family protein [Parvularcula sp. ZS-1/3]|uniref:Cytochrome c family protein n=1 Tax=Parvularcula mediterranea TaxID=2732508 RepID=A0A7Y3RKL4_9PROT|nr:c-type cytochrome [Parvularcula mediterranea]NNU15794.1 cytochrome c family protein [Parvularcula mediterranea]
MKDSLFSNKLAAVVLIVLLLFIGLPVVVNTMGVVFGGHHGHEYEEDNPFGLAYQPYAELAVSGGAQVEEVQVSLGCLLAEADATRGQRSAGVCAACHSFDAGGANLTGPKLWNVLGREVASVDGYGDYSGALKALGGDWTYDKLDQYLYNSSAYVPGTNMNQAIRKDNKRADILLYLGSLSDNPIEVPECVPPAAEEAPMEEAAAEAADGVDFEAPGPGETELPDQEVNTMEDDG